MNKLSVAPVLFLAALGLTACGGNSTSSSSTSAATTSTSPASTSTETSSVTPMPSDTASDAMSASPSATPMASDSTTAATTASASATSTAPVSTPKGTAVLLSTVPPKKVGDYTGSQLTTSGLGKGKSIMWQYTSSSDVTMTLDTTTVQHEVSVSKLEGTDKPLGKIASCGYLYKVKNAPVCEVRLEDGTNLAVNGDSTSTLDEVRSFTSQFLTLVKTK